ncbi:MAG: hypothetical protein AAF748_06340 [Pseudomonadota bacterium]
MTKNRSFSRLGWTGLLAIALTGPAIGQSFPNGWPAPNSKMMESPLYNEMMRRWMDMQRAPGFANRPRIPLPPIEGRPSPDGAAPAMDFADLLLQLQRAPGLMTPHVAAPALPVDTDQDGVVSDEEAASHAEATFVALDRDGSRSLSPDELAHRNILVMFAQPQDDSAEDDAAATRFAALDGDSDGAVSKAEFLDVARAHYEEARDPVSGTVTPWSYRRRDWF